MDLTELDAREMIGDFVDASVALAKPLFEI